MVKRYESVLHYAGILSTLLPLVAAMRIFANSTASDVLNLTGGRQVRIAWLRDRERTGDDLGVERYLMTWDTREGRERSLLMGVNVDLQAPEITADGNSIVFVNLDSGAIFVADWEIGQPRRIHPVTRGPITLWRSPATGHTWVYYENFSISPKGIYRFDLDDTSANEEVVWTQCIAPPPAHCDFGYMSLSADGSTMAGAFPWPYMGIASVPLGAYRAMCSSCCNGLIAPDTSGLVMYFYPDHEILNIDRYNSLTTSQSPVAKLALAAGVAAALRRQILPEKGVGWTTDPRFLISAGPLVPANDPRRISLRFVKVSSDFSTVTDCVPITDENRSTGGDDTFGGGRPIAWVEPAADERAVPVWRVDFSAPEGAFEPMTKETTVAGAVSFLQTDASWLTATTVGISPPDLRLRFTANPRGLVSGTYSGRARIRINGKLEIVAVYLRITGPSRPAAMAVYPTPAYLKPGDTIRFFADIRDQYNMAMEIPVRWWVSGGGSVDSQGVFISNGTQGIFAVRAQTGTVVAQAHVEIVNGDPLPFGFFRRLLRLVSARGDLWHELAPQETVGSPTPGGRIVIDNKEYIWCSDETSDISGMWTDTTPFRPFSTTWFAATVVSHEDRFIRIGARFLGTLNVWLNGKSIVANVGSSPGIAYSEVHLLPAGESTLIFSLSRHDSTWFFGAGLSDSLRGPLPGLRLASQREPDSTVFHLLSPNGSETLLQGDTLRILWNAVIKRARNAVVELTLDNGLSWFQISPGQAILPTDQHWSDLAWIIPDSLGGRPCVSDSCLVRIRDYDHRFSDCSDHVFSIGAVRLRQRVAKRSFPARLVVSRKAAMPALLLLRSQYQLQLVTVAGRLLWKGESSACSSHTTITHLPPIARGVVFLHGKIASQPLCQPILLE